MHHILLDTGGERGGREGRERGEGEEGERGGRGGDSREIPIKTYST